MRVIVGPTKMKLFLGLFLILSGVVAFRTLSHQRAVEVATDKQTATAVKQNAVPVVVELFTSEGCSSCPPADEVLSKLDKSQPIQGVEVIALGEHVDYWNKLGWIDPYSTADFSRRQSRYSDAFNQNSVYTPQMIVDGRDEFAGGNMDRARAAIARAAQSPKASIQLLSCDNSNAPNSGAVKLSVHVRDLPHVTDGDTAEVLLAVTENNLRSEVARGENAGRYLRHSAVVRELTQLGNVSAGQNFNSEPTVNLAKGWQKDNLRAVVFVQERRTRRIIGAAVLGLSAK
jgi:hypothetical protein